MSTHRRHPSHARRARDVVLSVGAAAGLLCIVATFASLLFGITPLIFRSGSMEPAIPSGALAFARGVPATELASGDVVSVVDDKGSRVTHRIVSVDSVAGNTALLTLKGDANPEPDTRPYGVSSADRILFHVPGLGYAVAWLGSPIGLLFVGAGAAALVWIALRPEGRRTSGQAGAGRDPAAPAVIAVSVITVVGLGLGHVPGTAAAFTDTATAQSGSFSSRPDFVPRIDQPVSGTNYVLCENIPAGTGAAKTVRLTWKHIGAPYGYRIVLRDADGQVWRTWNVADVQGSAGSNVSYIVTASGLPSRPTSRWYYSAEIHTMLPGPPTSSGAVSSSWRGTEVYQAATYAFRNDMYCSGGERGGDVEYIPRPSSLACTNSGTSAILGWPHVGSPYRYRVTLKDMNGNILRSTEVAASASATGTQVSHTVVRTLGSGTLPLGTLTAEVHTLRPTGSSTAASAEYLAYGLDYGRLITGGVSCVAAAASGSGRSLPQPSVATPTVTGTPTGTPTTPSGTTEPDATTGTDATTEPGPTTETGSGGVPEESGQDLPEPTVSPPVEPEPTVSPPVEPEPAEQPLGPAVPSPTGNHSARLVRSESATVVVIVASTGDEVFRTSASTGDTLRWVPGTDELRIEGASGTWSVSDAAGSWRKTAVPEASAPPAVGENSPTTTEPVPPDDAAPHPPDNDIPGG